ncbi:MAG TPA: hypothetical protein PLF31_03435 [Candidatus Paceibacterota bacterium]|nr:hypothetical protein [Candidatus Paceibacterota bacterium]
MPYNQNKRRIQILVGVVVVVLLIIVLSVRAYNNSKYGPPDVIPQRGPEDVIEGENTAATGTKSMVIDTSVGVGVSAYGIKVEPIEIVEDSRCPIDVQCIQMGTVRVKATVTSARDTTTVEFTLGEAETVSGDVITLSAVSPESVSGFDPQTSDYSFRFTVSVKP